MKLSKQYCPKCESVDTGDRWVRDGKLQRYCRVCNWRDIARIPETLVIQTRKEVLVGLFYGFHYDLFDRYGHYRTCSRYFKTKEEALQELNKEIDHGRKDQNRGPYTAVLWPSTAVIEGEVIT